MAHLTGFWHEFLTEMGNEPGAQRGDVTVHFVSPVEGTGEITVPSGRLSVAAEAGNLIGVLVQQDGRRLFVPASNVAGIVDAARKPAKPERPSGRGSVSAS